MTDVGQRRPREQPRLRVLDLSTVLAGPFATLFLADAGLDVVKIEAPEGDITRTVGRAPEPGMASIFQHINRNKRSVVLDLKTSAGLAALKRLAAEADAIVHNMRPEAARRLGIDYERIKAWNPRIVYCAFVGYGTAGPYAGRAAYDDLIQGLSAVADLEGRTRAGVPAYAPMSMADRIVGLYGAQALLAALLRRAATGEGACLEVPMFEVMAHFVLVEHMFYASYDPPIGPAVNPRNVDPNRRPLPTADGYLCVLPYSDAQWQRLFDLLERPDLRDDPRFATFTSRLDNITELYGILAAAMATRTTAQWLPVLEAADIPAARMNTIDDLISDPHLRAVGFFRPQQQEASCFLQMAPPVVWRDDEEVPLRRAPRLGEHGRDLLRDAGLSDDEIEAVLTARATREAAQLES